MKAILVLALTLPFSAHALSDFVKVRSIQQSGDLMPSPRGHESRVIDTTVKIEYYACGDFNDRLEIFNLMLIYPKFKAGTPILRVKVGDAIDCAGTERARKLTLITQEFGEMPDEVRVATKDGIKRMKVKKYFTH